MDKILLNNLVEQGLSTRQIAEHTDKSQTAVRYWLAKHGLVTGKKHRCKCGETDPDAFFLGRFTACKKCRRQDANERLRLLKDKAIDYKGGRCEACGYNRCAASLDFHHEDPASKDPNWSKMRQWSFGKIKKELDKCLLVCRNCHGELHYPHLVTGK
jgi:hypothetical protein